jgi:hypothetical protein
MPVTHPIIDVAKALAALLDAASFSQPVTVTRRALVRFDLVGLKTCQVSVVPADWESPIVTRAATRDKVQVDVAIQQKVDVDDLDATDALMNLVYEIEAAVKFAKLSTTPAYVWAGVEQIAGCAPGFAPEHMDNSLRTFTSVRRHTFVPGI